MLSVRVRFYASLREHFGQTEREVTVDEGALVSDVVNQLAPEALRGGLQCAVNDSFVHGDTRLHQGDILDLLPPFGGG